MDGMLERIPGTTGAKEMATNRHRSTANSKAKVVMEALRGDRAIQVIAANSGFPSSPPTKFAVFARDPWFRMSGTIQVSEST